MMRLRWKYVAFSVLLLTGLNAKAETFNATKYGAKGDGVTLATKAIQQAIDAAAKSHGTVVLDPGTYLTGSIFVKNGVTLQLDKGVTLLGSQRLEDYPLMPSRIAGIEMTWPAALVNIYKQQGVTITGEGTIDGDGKVWWDGYWALRKEDDPKGLRWASDYDSKRPRLIQVFDSSDVKLNGGLMLRRSGFWTVHICYSHDVTVDGVTIRNNEGGKGPSTDGIDIDSSRKVLVAHADIAVNDDALCLKAGRDSDGLRVNRVTEDVVLRDSIVREGAAGVTIGSETSGGFRNIEAYNITTLKAVPNGVLFKSAHTRGGFAEDIRIHDMTMVDTATVSRVTMNWNPNYSYAKIPDGLTNYPAYYKVLATPVPDSQGIAHFKDIHIWNVKATGAKTVFDVSAYPVAPLKDFELDHWNVEAQTAGKLADVDDWKLHDMHFDIGDGSAVATADAQNVTGLPQQSAAKTPLPTPEMQAIIDKDSGRHFGDAPKDGGPMATDLESTLTPAAIDEAMHKVANWELAWSQPYQDRIWTWSVQYSGFMAASAAMNDPKYRDNMAAMSAKFNYELRSKQPNADDQSVAQTYLELALLRGKPYDQKMIAPTQAQLDSVIGLQTLTPTDPRIPWWWCDALFMAPPVWARMYAVTGDQKYIDYLNTQFQRTSDLLYDKEEHLYARDATYIPKRGPNGKKIFWSRGEGWVMGGIARTLPYLPKDDPHRAFYVQQLREMATKVASLQDKDGLWHASLLDPEHFPAPEISSSALFVFSMAWGVNEGILDRATYMPVIERGWRGLIQHIYADGRLGDIQQTGAEPAYYLPTSSFDYGVGAFLMAGAEVRKLSQLTTDPGNHEPIELGTPANPKLPTIWLVGDSTVRNGKDDGANNQMGWGRPFARYFDPSKVNVVNRAIGGRSSRTYITEGHWADVLALIKPGDVILLQMGHNDGGPLDDKDRARGSLRGIGDETQEIENPVMKKHETVHTYGWYMKQYVEEGRAKGATVIICSQVPRKIWKDGKITRDAATYAGWAHQVADMEHIQFIDLNEITARKYDALGQAAVEPLFGDEHTHTTLAGAIINAESVVQGLKALPDDPVAKDFSADGKALKAYVK
jgi:unsaturated rhamnogalacturonyl hydrolase